MCVVAEGRRGLSALSVRLYVCVCGDARGQGMTAGVVEVMVYARPAGGVGGVFGFTFSRYFPSGSGRLSSATTRRASSSEISSTSSPSRSRAVWPSAGNADYLLACQPVVCGSVRVCVHVTFISKSYRLVILRFNTHAASIHTQHAVLLL